MFVIKGLDLEGENIQGQSLWRETVWETCRWCVGSCALSVHLSWESDAWGYDFAVHLFTQAETLPGVSSTHAMSANAGFRSVS